MREDGLRIPGIARRAAWAELRWTPRDSLDVLLQAQSSSRVYANDANTAAAPGYARWDLGVEKRMRWGGFALRGYARVNNLLDRDIVGSVIVNEGNGRYFEPAPGRHWVLGMTVERRFE